MVFKFVALSTSCSLMAVFSWAEAAVLSTIFPLYFVQCHRSIIVNLDYVEKIVKRDLYLSGGVVLPVSKKYLKPLLSAYMKNLQLNGF